MRDKVDPAKSSKGLARLAAFAAYVLQRTAQRPLVARTSRLAGPLGGLPFVLCYLSTAHLSAKRTKQKNARRDVLAKLRAWARVWAISRSIGKARKKRHERRGERARSGRQLHRPLGTKAVRAVARFLQHSMGEMETVLVPLHTTSGRISTHAPFTKSISLCFKSTSSLSPSYQSFIAIHPSSFLRILQRALLSSLKRESPRKRYIPSSF